MPIRSLRSAAPIFAASVLLAAAGFVTPRGAAAQEHEPTHEHGHQHGHQHGSEHGEHMKHDEYGQHDDDGEHSEHGVGHGKGYHHDFSDVERWAKIFDDPERVEWQKPETVVALLDIAPGMRLVDLGAGTGFFLGYLSVATGEDGEVMAVDIEESLVQHMAERAAEAGWANVVSRLAAPDDPGLDHGSVDRILIVDVWHHIDDRGAYAAKLLEALRPDGQVMVVDFDLDSPEGPPKQHRLSPEQVAAELRAGGLEAEIVEEDLPRQYIVVASAP